MVAHNELTDTKVRRETVAPIDAPNFVGEVYVEDNSVADTGRCLRVAKGIASAADFVVVSFIPQKCSGNPNGLVTSRCDRDLCIDTANNALFYAPTGETTSWTSLGGSAGGGGS